MQYCMMLPILTLTLISGVGLAAESYTALRTEWGAPDLQGVWNFSSNTPMQRPLRYGDRQFLNEAEIAELEAKSRRETRPLMLRFPAPASMRPIMIFG